MSKYRLYVSKDGDLRYVIGKSKRGLFDVSMSLFNFTINGLEINTDLDLVFTGFGSCKEYRGKINWID